MSDTRQRELLEELRDRFGDRCKARPSGVGEALAAVSPVDAGEVEFLAEVARQSEVRILPMGAGTAPETNVAGALLVTFDLMRGMSVEKRAGDPVEVEPGVPWIQLEDHLRQRGAGLRVYPTSAPQTTVGGWLHLDGLGVGSYEFGWLSETSPRSRSWSQGAHGAASAAGSSLPSVVRRPPSS